MRVIPDHLAGPVDLFRDSSGLVHEGFVASATRPGAIGHDEEALRSCQTNRLEYLCGDDRPVIDEQNYGSCNKRRQLSLRPIPFNVRTTG